MRTVCVALVGSVLLAGTAQGSGVQLFNTEVLGQPTSGAVKLLGERQPGDIEPYVLWTDVKCGRYVAASAFYNNQVRVAEVVAAVDKVYGVWKVAAGPVWEWRVDKRFVIHVVEEEQDAESAVRITYYPFPTKNGGCGDT